MTNKQASAPGLSGPEIARLADVLDSQVESVFANKVLSALTRASAATVAEPSKSKLMRYAALEQAALEAHLDIESACEKIGLPAPSKAPQQQAEPALVQMRMRPMWREEGSGWTEWGNIPEAAAQEYERHPVYQDWQYEVRRLYLGAQSGQRAGVAEDAVTRNSAIAAIYYVEQYNGPGRAKEAITMLAVAPTQQQEGNT